MNIHNLWNYIKEHFNEIFVICLFSSFLYFMHTYKDIFVKGGVYEGYAMPSVALFGFFLAWIQFLFHKKNIKKEAALTYFPRPLELETLENSIDAIIGFWSRHEPLDNYEVKLMTGSKIKKEEYILIWDKLSISNKNTLDKRLSNKDEAKNNAKYDPKYDQGIDELYREARRKLNAYLNQIEGYCLAVNKGNIDLKSSKDLFAHKFAANFRKARPYIETVREDKKDNSIYIEFEKVLRKWGSI